MSYEIPQQLEYKEKIIFGLTFRQLAYAFIFAPVLIGIFFKSGWNLFIRVFLTSFIGCVAVGFMYLNLDYHLKSWIVWLKFRKVKEKDKLRSFVGVHDIKEDYIYTIDNRKLAVLKIEPINFSIKPQEAQEVIIASFQKFLNFLDFPVQIVMNTESLNLQAYLHETQRKAANNPEFARLFPKYKEDLTNLTKHGNVVNRNFYLIIPQKHNLSIQVDLCQKKLASIGLKSRRLKDAELRQLIQVFFLGEEQKLQPKHIENEPASLKMNHLFTKVLYAHGYPRHVESGFLDKLVSLFGEFDLSLHIEPYDIETTMISINKELQKQRADLYSAQTKGILNPSLEIKYADTRAILENLQKGKEKLFNISLYINCRAKTKEDLDLLTKRIESELNSLLIIPRYPYFRMAQGLQSCAPLAHNKLAMRRNVPTGALSAFFPFTSSFLQADMSGIWLGLNKNNIPIIKDIFKLSNPNGFCLASSGSGKSYMAKLMIARHLLHGTKVMVIDPQGEYSRLVDRFKGQRIDLSRTSDTIINPLDLMGHDYQEKRLALMDLMQIMLGELTEPQKSFIDRAITEAYSECGIGHDPDSWSRTPPILEDVLHSLKHMEEKASTIEKSTLRSLINRLDMYVTGVFSFLNQQTHIDFNNPFVCFDIGNLSKQIKPTMMFLVLDYVYMKMKQDLSRKLLVIDEAWSLLSRSADASYIFEIVKTCRKFNLALFLINQEVEGMLDSAAGKSVLANSSYTLLMRQKPAVIKQVQATFSLSDTERALLLTAGIGEGILLMDDEHSEIRIVASADEHKIITTNADELLAQQKTVTPLAALSQTSSMRFNPQQRVYALKTLRPGDIKVLTRRGFRHVEYKSIFGHNQRYIVKDSPKESAHHILLIHEIAKYLEEKGAKVETYRTLRPDIVFELYGIKYAVEVETGTFLKRNKTQLAEKVAAVKREFGKNWFFVVTNRNITKRYKLFGMTYHKRNIKRFLNKITKSKKWH